MSVTVVEGPTDVVEVSEQGAPSVLVYPPLQDVALVVTQAPPPEAVEVMVSASAQVVEVAGAAASVVELELPVESSVVELLVPGSQGPPGSVGPAGPQGPPGMNADTVLTYQQSQASMVWEFTHPFPYRPVAETFDNNGELMEGDVSYPSPATVRVTFGFDMIGSLVLRG